MEKFPLAIGRLYEHLIMKPQKIKIIADMFEEIRKTYRGRIVDPISEPWLDSISRAAAVEKLDFMQHAISLPQLARNPNFVSGFYQGINFTAFSSDSSMPGILQTVRFVNHSPYRFLKMDLSTVVLMTMQDWTEVNAFYVAELNTMIIPMGLWDSRLNAPSTIPAFNFGVIGAVIGHEITHGFDNNGIQFDKYGNSKPIMSDATAKSFLKNSRCFVSHFSEFSYRGIPTFGNQTLAENIADNGGIKVAYQAYSNSISEHSGQSSQLFGYRQLPGIDFLNYKQLFWIGNAQFWCSSISKIEAKLRQVSSVFYCVYVYLHNR
jgi:predicted metalloendopeptidase